MGEIVTHELLPFIFAEAKVLILGTMPSPKSRAQGFYYGHPQNRFWKTLACVYGEIVPRETEEKKDFLLKHKIALWDVLYSCEIVGASDASIKNPIANDISAAISETDIAAIFTTGRTAYNLLKKLTGIEGILLPSPSPANCAVNDFELVSKYSQIKDFTQ